MKKRVKMLCFAMAVSMIASIFTGCQTKVTEGTSGGQVSLGGQVAFGNNGNAGGIVNQVQATTMACKELH